MERKVESTFPGMWQLNAQDLIIKFNNRAQKRLCLPQMELPLREFANLTPHSKQVYQSLKHAAQTLDAVNLFTRINTQEIVLKAEPAPSEDGLWGIVQQAQQHSLSANDQSSQQHLFSLEPFLKQFLAKAPYELVVLDENYHFVYANEKSLKKIKHREKIDLAVGDSLDKLQAYDIAKLKGLLQNAREKGSVVFNLPFPEKQTTVWYSVSIQYLPAGSKNFYAVSGMEITDLRKSIDLLQESEERFRQFFENSPIGLIYHDSKGQASFLSPSLKSILPKNMAELYKQNWFDFLQLNAPFFQNSDNPGQGVYTQEVKIGKHFVKVVSIKMNAEKQTEPHFLTALVDQTQAHQDQQALLSFQNRLQVTAQFAGIGTWEYHPHTDTLIWDPQMWKLISRSPEEQKNLNLAFFTQYLHPDDREPLIEDFKTAIAEQRFFQAVFRIMDQNHRLKYLQGFAQITTDENGETIVLGINYDVTQEQLNSLKINELNKELKHKEKRLSAILEQGKDAIIIHDEGGMITYCSSSVQNVTLYHPDDLLGQSIRDYFTEVKLISDERWQNFLQTPGDTFTIESQFTKADGSKITVETNVTNLLYEPAVQGIVANFRDISLRVQSLREKRNAIKLSEELNRIKSNFLANMSHELRTPLNGLLGVTEILETQFQPNPEMQELLQMQKESGERLLKTLSGLIEFSKLESDAAHFKLVSLDLSSILHEVAEEKRTDFELRKQNLQLKTPACELIIKGDRKIVRDIFSHILDNASKFSGPNPIKVFVNFTKKNQIKIMVQDEGVGISPEFQPRIFEPFVQENTDYRHRRYQGSGLGLAIVKKYLTLLGGHISVESTIGLGSTFTVVLPLIRKNPVATAQKNKAP